MNIDIMQVIGIIIIAGLVYWTNDKLNNVPTLKKIVQVLIVVVAVVLLLQSIGIIGSINPRINVN